MPMHDPDQVWNMEFKDTAPTWIPRTFIDQMEMFGDGQASKPEKSSPQGFEGRDSIFGVARHGAT